MMYHTRNFPKNLHKITSQSEIEEMRQAPLCPNWSVSVTEILTKQLTKGQRWSTEMLVASNNSTDNLDDTSYYTLTCAYDKRPFCCSSLWTVFVNQVAVISRGIHASKKVAILDYILIWLVTRVPSRTPAGILQVGPGCGCGYVGRVGMVVGWVGWVWWYVGDQT